MKNGLIFSALVLTTLLISQITFGCQRPSEVTSPQEETMSLTPSQSSEQPPDQYKNGDSELDIIPTPTPNLFDESIQWESLQGPPGGGTVRDLVQNPYNTSELYTVIKGNIYKSENKGKNWRLVDGLENVIISAIAISEDKLFVCGNGLKYFDENDNLIQINGEWWDSVFISDNKIFITRNAEAEGNIIIRYANLGSENLLWQDITPTTIELGELALLLSNSELSRYVEITHVVASGDRILINIVVNVEGSGEMTKGNLYISDDAGKTWNPKEFDIPDSVIASAIVQNPLNPNHIVVGFRHPILHEFTYPISQMIFETHDAGNTWSNMTNLDRPTNGIADITIANSVYYVTNPWDGYILKLDGTQYEYLAMPTVEEFGEIGFGLAKLIIDPDDGNIVYGMTDPIWALGLVKSEDNMRTWHKMDGDIIGTSPTILITHPTNPGTIYTTSNVLQEAYMTRDGGKTWEPFSPTSSDDEVRIDPFNPDHILLITEMSTIYESFDSGKTWKQINTGFSSAKILDFEISQGIINYIYASNMGVGISRVSEEPEWQYLINSPDYVYDIELDPDDNSIIYASYSPKLFENHSSIWRYSPYQQEGFGWSEILRLEDTRGITSIAFDANDPNNLYAGVIGDRGAIYASNDRGNTWHVLNDDFIMCTVWGQSQLMVDPYNSSTAYAATWLGGTWKTKDAGATWTLLKEAPISSTALSINNKNTDIVYLADRSSPTVWKSEDGGNIWHEMANFTSDGALLVMRVLVDGDIVYASTFNPALGGGKLYKSSDAGINWSDVTGTLPKGILDIAIDPTNSDIVYITTNINGVYKSTDGGTNWLRLDKHPYVGVYDIEVDPINPTILYTAARGGSLPSWFTEISGDFPDGISFEDSAGVYKSTDSGNTWEKILATTASCRTVRLHPDEHNVLFALDLIDGLKISTDAGKSWSFVSAELGTQVLTSCAIGSDRIYVGTQGCGVNGGDFDLNTNQITWQKSRSNKPVPEVYNIQIQVDPTNSNNIFITSYPGGMYASVDGGLTLRDRNAITPSVVVDYPLQEGYYALAINPNDSTNMWMGTWGKGIYESYNSMLLNVPAGLFGKHIRKVVIDPQDPNVVYAATKEGVFVTKDEGVSWEVMNNGLGTTDIISLKLLSMDLNPFSDDFEDDDSQFWQFDDGWSVIKDGENYVLQGTGHAWANTGQDSWSDYTFEARIKPVIYGGIHIVFRKNNEGRYFLGFHQGGLYLSKQYNQWSEFDNNIATSSGSFSPNQWYDFRLEVVGDRIQIYINDILKIDYIDSDPLLNGSIAFETLDDQTIFYIDDIQVTMHKTDHQLYAGTNGYGIYKYDFTIGQWKNLGRTLGGGWWNPWERRMYQFSSLLFHPDVSGRVFLGHFPSGFFISEDGGHNWVDSSLGLGNDGMFSLTMHPHNHDILYAGTYNGVFKSMDGGHTWEMKSNGMPSEQWPYTIAIDDNEPNIMYASTKNGQNKGFCHRNSFCGIVMKSTDGGESWFQIMNGLDEKSEFYTLLIYPLNHDILFLSTNRGVYISRDAGNTWQAANSGLPNTHNQVRDNVAQNLTLTADHKYLILGLVNYGIWKADLSGIE